MLESGKGMELNFKNEEKPSYFEIIFKRLKEFIFEVQFLVLKYQSTSSIWIEIFVNVIQLFQYLSFSFDPIVNIINKFSLKKFNNQNNYLE
jgi:hypothetical protein